MHSVLPSSGTMPRSGGVVEPIPVGAVGPNDGGIPVSRVFKDQRIISKIDTYILKLDWLCASFSPILIP